MRTADLFVLGFPCDLRIEGGAAPLLLHGPGGPRFSITVSTLVGDLLAAARAITLGPVFQRVVHPRCGKCGDTGLSLGVSYRTSGDLRGLTLIDWDFKAYRGQCGACGHHSAPHELDYDVVLAALIVERETDLRVIGKVLNEAPACDLCGGAGRIGDDIPCMRCSR